MKNRKMHVARLKPGARIETVRIADGKPLYIRKDGDRERVVFGDHEQAAHHRILDLTYVHGTVAYRVYEHDSQHIVWGDIEDKPYREIYDIDFSTGRRFYRVKNGKSAFYVYDGQEGPSQDAIVECWLDGPENNVPTGSAKIHDRWFTFYGDWMSYAYDFVWDPILFKGELLFMARTGSQYRIVHGKNEEPLYDSAFGLTTTASHYAYIAKRGDITLVVVDGVIRHESDEVKWFRFTRNDEMCFASKLGKKWCAVLGSHVDEFVDELFTLQTTEAGELLTSFRIGDKSYVKHGTRKSAAYDWVGIPKLQSGKLVFEAKRRGQWFIVVDGNENHVQGEVRSIELSPNGMPSYIERCDELERIVSGKCQGRLFQSVGRPVQVNGRLHYPAYESHTWCVVTNRQRGRAFRDLSELRVVGDHLIYLGESFGSRDTVRLVTDRKLGRPFNRIFGVTRNQKSLTYYGIKKLDVFEVTVPLHENGVFA